MKLVENGKSRIKLCHYIPNWSITPIEVINKLNIEDCLAIFDPTNPKIQRYNYDIAIKIWSRAVALGIDVKSEMEKIKVSGKCDDITRGWPKCYKESFETVRSLSICTQCCKLGEIWANIPSFLSGLKEYEKRKLNNAIVIPDEETKFSKKPRF